MAINMKLPVIIEVNQDGQDGKFEVEQFINNFRKITGMRLKKKCIDKGYGSSHAPWILYVEKDAAYLKLLEKSAKSHCNIG